MEISIALGGGGVKGNAHIGVLRVLEHEGFKFQAMAGTSMGALVAAAYLSGHSPDEIEDLFSQVDQSKLYGRGENEGPALLGLAGVTKLLLGFLEDRTFADLPVPLAVTAVDINSGQEVVLDSGRLVDAVLASIALPGIFPPREIGEALLVDGAMINPVPTGLARSLSPKSPVVAVVLSQLPENQEAFQLPEDDGPIPVLERITRLRFAQAFNIFMRSLDISGRLLTELRLQIDQPDVIIRPDVTGIGILDRVDIHDLVFRGEVAAEKALPKIYRTVRWDYKLSKGLKINKMVDRFRVRRDAK